MNESDKSLKNQWGNFFSAILSPHVLFFLLCTGGLLSLNYFIEDNKIISAIISALMVLSGGLAGAYYRKRWEELTEKPHLLAKGKMAVRNLRLLFNNIGYYESRLKVYINRLENNDVTKEREREYLEEIIDWCLSLKEICLTSIENWEDIIPDVKDLTSKIGTLFELKIREDELKKQIGSLTDKLEESEEAKAKTEEEKEELEKQLSKKEEEFSKVEEQVRNLRHSIRTSVGGMSSNLATLATSTTSMPFAFGGPTSKVCQYCKKEFDPSLADILSGSYICGECRTQGRGTRLSDVLKNK